MLKSFIDFKNYDTNDNNMTSSPITSSPFNSNSHRYHKRSLRIKQKEITSDSSNNETLNLNTKNKTNHKSKELIVVNQQKASASYDVTDL